MSRQRSLRKVRVDDDGEEEDQGSQAQPPASVKAAQQRRDKGRKALLSFDDGGGGDAGGGERGGQGRKGAKGRLSLKARDPAAGLLDGTASGPSAVHGAGEGAYTAEKLQELQRATPRPPGAKAGGGEGAFKLSGSFKAAAPPKDDRFAHSVAAVGVLETAAMPLPPPPLPPGAARAAGDGTEPAAAAAPAAAADILEDEDEEGGIPDEQMILRIKAKRERLRSAHLAPDYIPTAAIHARAILPPPGARALGGDRDSALDGLLGEPGVGKGGSDDEEAEPEDALRMQFVGKAGGAGAGRARESADEEGEEEEEEDAWAEEQIKKGMGGGASRAVAAAAPRLAPSAAAARPPDAGGFGPGRAPAAGPAASGASQGAAIAAAADEVVASLQATLQRVQVSQRQAEKNLARTQRSLEDCTAGLARVEGDIRAAGDKYAYVQQLRAYLADLCAMLAHKSPLAEELEEELCRLRAERARAHADRRADEEREAGAAAQAAVVAALGALSHGAGLEEASRIAAEAAEAAERKLLSGGELPTELDEFGRDVNAQRKGQAAARLRLRADRLAALEPRFRRPPPSDAAAAAAWREPSLGGNTTDESDGEVSHYASRVEEIQEAAGAVFRDAGEEFGSVRAVKAALEGWKARYPGQYRDAYVSLSAPALFAPFVRLELLRWAPLDGAPRGAQNGGGAGFDQHEWYRLLFNYGMHAEHADPSDPDADLVPRLVRSLVLPLAERLLREVWDPLSARQSAAAASMLEDLLLYVPPEDAGLARALRLVQERLETAVGASALPAWPPATLASSRRAEVHLARRFGRALRLLRSTAAFRAALPPAELQALGVGRLLGGVLLPYVRAAAGDPAAAAQRAQRVVAALPDDWLRGGVPHGAEGLAELLVAVARQLEGRAADPAARAAGAPVAKQLADVLAKLGDLPAARRLALMYGIVQSA